MKKTIYWIPALLYMAMIFYLSSGAPPEPAKHAPMLVHIKLVHIIEYSALYALIFFAVRMSCKIPYNWQVVYCVFLTYIYGLTDELHQALVRGRTASLIDCFTNLLAAALMQAALSAALIWRDKHLNKAVIAAGAVKDKNEL
ncbi:MAG: VanZ family protein [Candidatus Saganbacteria bacterium]|nr:VanZ family protein [Candidatus Saganbacteria bacterium]